MVLKKVGVLSVAKITGAMGVLVGLLIGAFMTLLALMGVAVHVEDQGGGNAALPMLVMGAGAIVFVPVMYGVMGFISGLIYGALYNVLAGFVGGIEMEFDTSPTIS